MSMPGKPVPEEEFPETVWFARSYDQLPIGSLRGKAFHIRRDCVRRGETIPLALTYAKSYGMVPCGRCTKRNQHSGANGRATW